MSNFTRSKVFIKKTVANMLIKNCYGFYFEKNLVSQDQSGKGKQKLKYNAVCQTLSLNHHGAVDVKVLQW